MTTNSSQQLYSNPYPVKDFFSEVLIMKKGKNYKMADKSIGTIWKVWQAVQLIFLVISSLGTHSGFLHYFFTLLKAT